ncbi:MAG: hypothetical protein QXS38_00850 [Candidatus Pacearchaeota archaeon]
MESIDCLSCIFEFIAEELDDHFKNPGMSAYLSVVDGLRFVRFLGSRILTKERIKELEDRERCTILQCYERAVRASRTKSKSY